MDLQEFTAATAQEAPPKGLNPALEALCHLRKGDWNRAHEIVQAHEDVKGYAAVHAHLHRIEGDIANARYWYRRAGRPMPEGNPEQEWKALAAHFLGEQEE